MVSPGSCSQHLGVLWAKGSGEASRAILGPTGAGAASSLRPSSGLQAAALRIQPRGWEGVSPPGGESPWGVGM